MLDYVSIQKTSSMQSTVKLTLCSILNHIQFQDNSTIESSVLYKNMFKHQENLTVKIF